MVWRDPPALPRRDVQEKTLRATTAGLAWRVDSRRRAVGTAAARVKGERAAAVPPAGAAGGRRGGTDGGGEPAAWTRTLNLPAVGKGDFVGDCPFLDRAVPVSAAG
ncbi:hypothetical protein GCM10010361_62610 [Streptomyces olivaceiscleroticus]|uniref:Uncharacterized protein n=1 Tax=Streptomyces olivaceiscleroticus TaxID=68245 RepID=A0ABN1B2F8_9ACTN